MNSTTLHDHVTVTKDNLETLREALPVDQARELAIGQEVSVYRFPLSGGQHGTIAVYWREKRFAISMGADSQWGDVELTDDPQRPVKLWPDEEPDSVGGPFWIDPELAAWVEGYEFVPFPLDPTEALVVAREAGREWAGNLDPDEIEDGDEFSEIVSNANAPAFPNCPNRETYDAAYETAEAAVFPEGTARLTVDMENDSEEWWNALRELSTRGTPATQSEQDLLKILDPGRDEVCLPLERARAAFALAQTLSGWNDPEASEFAPHPLLGYGLDADGELY